MAQRMTTEAELYERAFPPRDLAYWLGQVLSYPVADIPTVEDLEREQGLLGLPTEAQSARQAGQSVLDFAAMAHGLASLLRGTSGAAQELMGKRRGAETFGKEMMDTSRRAYPKKWERIQAEEWRPQGEPEVPRPQRQQPPSGHLIPEGRPTWRQGERLPADVVQPDPVHTRLGPVPAYRIGEPVPLPGGEQVQYVVIPGAWSHHVALYDGSGMRLIDTVETVGEALARARQLQNRLALAAQDPVLLDPLHPGARQVRFPWERSTSSGPQRPGQHGALWRYDYMEPPASGRWSE